MKILFVVQRYYPSIGGTQNLVKNLAENLVAKGHQITVVTSDSLSQQDIRGFSFTKGLRLSSTNNHLPQQENINSVRVLRFRPLFQILTYMINPHMFSWLRGNIAQYDVVHAFCYMFAEPDMVALLKKKRPSIKFILSPHDFVIPENASRFFQFFKRLYDKTIGSFTLKQANKIILLTPANKKQLQAIAPQHLRKSQVIPPGIHIPPQINFDQKIKNRILFVGRFVEYKGAQYIIKAIKFLRDKGLNIRGVFIGNDQGYLPTLKKLVKEFNLQKAIIFRENLTDKELAQEYQKAEFFILPSSNEGFGIVVAEAASYGCIPIVLDKGGLKFVGKDLNAYMLKSNNVVSEIVNIIITINNQFNESKMKKVYQKYVELAQKHYSWNQVIKQYEKTYLC